MMYAPLIFNMLLLLGVFIVSVVVDVSLYKNYMSNSEEERTLSMDIVYLFSISVITLILTIYQVNIYINKYIVIFLMI